MASHETDVLKDMAVTAYEASYTSDYYLRFDAADLSEAKDIIDPLLITAIFAAPDSDMLIKRHFPVADNLELASQALESISETLAEGALALPDPAAMNIVDSIKAAKREHFGEDVDRELPADSLQLLGLMAVHSSVYYGGRPVQIGDTTVLVVSPVQDTTAVIVTSRSFIETYLEEYPISNALQTIVELEEDDPLLEEMYKIQVEHGRFEGTLEEYREILANSVPGVESSAERDEHARMIAAATLCLSMLPVDYTHPVLQEHLFEAA